MIAAALAAFWATAASAREPAGHLSLREALALTLRQNPELAVFDAEVRIAEARILQARLIPNPELNLTSENIGHTQAEEDTLLLGQLIELGGKRAARVREAKASRVLVEFDYETKKREVFRQTAEQFIDLLAAQRRIGLNEELVRRANEFGPAVQRRSDAGKASELERTRFEVASASAQIELEQAQRDAVAARHRLAAQWGSTRPHFTRAIGDLEAMPATTSLDVLARRLAQNPRLIRFGAELTQRQAALARETAAAIPDVTLQAGPRRLAATDDATAVVGLSVPLPFWNRNQGNIRAARAQIDRAEAEKTAVASALMTELSEAYQKRERARSTVITLRERVLPGAERALAATNEGYDAGRFNYLEVLEASRTLSGARLQYLEALTAFHKSEQTIHALTAAPRTRNWPNE